MLTSPVVPDTAASIRSWKAYVRSALSDTEYGRAQSYRGAPVRCPEYPSVRVSGTQSTGTPVTVISVGTISLTLAAGSPEPRFANQAGPLFLKVSGAVTFWFRPRARRVRTRCPPPVHVLAPRRRTPGGALGVPP